MGALPLPLNATFTGCPAQAATSATGFKVGTGFIRTSKVSDTPVQPFAAGVTVNWATMGTVVLDDGNTIAPLPEAANPI